MSWGSVVGSAFVGARATASEVGRRAGAAVGRTPVPAAGWAALTVTATAARPVLDGLGDAARVVRGLPERDERQCRYLTAESARWMVQNRAWGSFYRVRYLRLARLRLARPSITTEGMVFLGEGIDLFARPGFGRLVIGRWTHIGSGNALRAHEGTLRIGEKCVFGKDNTVNCYLDVEFGAATIVADWVYVCDFDHIFSDVTYPLKDQGIAKSPVRIGPDVWIGTKVTVLRGTHVGRGSVIAANAVVNRDLPDWSVNVGIPARPVRNRMADYLADEAAAKRAALADIARRQDAAAAVVAGQLVEPAVL